MKWLRQTSWPPYAVGALIGVLSWFAFASADHPLGITSAFEHTGALLGAANPEYYAENDPKIGWEWMLVLGVFLGALLSSWLSGDRHPWLVPPLWRRQFGPRAWPRLTAAFLGGLIMLLGARIAGGCTSGHSISGNLQLAVSSLIFTAVFFPVAIATAHLMFRGEDRHA